MFAKKKSTIKNQPTISYTRLTEYTKDTNMLSAFHEKFGEQKFYIQSPISIGALLLPGPKFYLNKKIVGYRPIWKIDENEHFSLEEFQNFVYKQKWDGLEYDEIIFDMITEENMLNEERTRLLNNAKNHIEELGNRVRVKTCSSITDEWEVETYKETYGPELKKQLRKIETQLDISEFIA